MNRVRFLRGAQREARAAALFYEERGTGLGQKFLDALDRAVHIASENPLAGSPGPAGTRKIMVSGFPYALVYLIEDSTILVAAVAHHARRPAYWAPRI